VSRGIFLIGADERLVEMREQPYDSEELLQRLLASYPSLLAGDLVNPVNPRKWLLAPDIEAAATLMRGGVFAAIWNRS
jgi:hypothetical protein